MSGGHRGDSVLFEAPELDEREREVLAEIASLKQSLRFQLAQPRRWSGALRRMTFARNIQGSNTIEGFDASLDDAAAVVLGEVPLGTDAETTLALVGYQNAMNYVLQMAQDPELVVSEQLIKSLHFMMTAYSMRNRPGLWRAGAIFVQRDGSGEVVHEGASIDRVPMLMAALAETINSGLNGGASIGAGTGADARAGTGTNARVGTGADARAGTGTNTRTNEQGGEPIVRAAMAHLNLVMIHPFRDGNGRMGRVLQTLVLAADGTLSPVFSSIEEYLGRNTLAYYDVLAQVGGGSWQPERDTRPWLRFILTAHWRQGHTVQTRVRSGEQIWGELEKLRGRARIPERTLATLFDAVYGYRLRRSTYMAALKEGGEEISENTATRDFGALVAAGLLEAHGDKRGRFYTGTQLLRDIRSRVRASEPARDSTDPFGRA